MTKTDELVDIPDVDPAPWDEARANLFLLDLGLIDQDEVDLRAFEQQAAAEAEEASRQTPQQRYEITDDEIDQEVRKRLLRDLTERRYREATAQPLPEFTDGLVSEVWDRAPDPQPIIETLLPLGGNLLLNAQRKAGKTSMVLNLIEALTTGSPFLGHLKTLPVTGRVGLLDFELTDGLFSDYTKGLLSRPERVYRNGLLGRTNPLASERGRKWQAERLRAMDVEILVVDPFLSAMSYTGLSENDNSGTRAWLDELQRWAIEDCGVKALVLLNHSGWNGDRSRGASAIEDWANVIGGIRLEDRDDLSSARFFSAFGRLGFIDEDMLHFDETTKRMTLSGFGSRKAVATRTRSDEIKPAILSILDDHELSVGEIDKALKTRGISVKDQIRVKALADLVKSGEITERKDGRSKLYGINLFPEILDPDDNH